MNLDTYVERSREVLQTDLALTTRMLLAGAAIFSFYFVVASILIAFVGAGIGYAFGGIGAVLGGFLVTVAIVYAQYRLSVSKLRSAEDAHPLDPEANPELAENVETVAAELGMSTPDLLRAEMGSPNAFAFGAGEDATVVFSDELLTLLEPAELQAVAAHELAHLRNHDTVLMQLSESVRWMVKVGVMLGIALYGFFLAMGIQGRDEVPIITAIRRALRSLRTGWTGWAIVVGGTLAGAVVSVFTMALSRYREYVADQTAVEATGDPEAMTNALQKIDAAAEEWSELEQDVPAALCIHGDVSGILSRLFASHPPMENRIERLERIFE